MDSALSSTVPPFITDPKRKLWHSQKIAKISDLPVGWKIFRVVKFGEQFCRRFSRLQAVGAPAREASEICGGSRENSQLWIFATSSSLKWWPECPLRQACSSQIVVWTILFLNINK